MADKFWGLDGATIKALRSVQLLHDRGEIDGVKFVRCGRNVTDGFRIAREIREATGDTEAQVTCRNHPDYGDYIFVSVDSRTYEYIGYMKS